MTAAEFRAYRRGFEHELVSLLSSRPPHAFDEQGLPAYTHPNRIARWLFWQRVRVVLRECDRLRPGSVLDFGCGAGVLFPALRARNARIHACDVDLSAAKELAARHGWDGVVWVDPPDRLADLAPGTFDLILALDVLEHVEGQALDRLAACFASLLRPQGRLLVSGPTESWLYRTGRWIAGFSGDYHVRSIGDVEASLSTRFRLQLVAELYWPATLFRIVSATVRR